MSAILSPVTISAELDARIYACYKSKRKQMKNSLRRRRGITIITAAEQRQIAREQMKTLAA